MFVCGIPVRDELVLELAHVVDDPELAERLEPPTGMVKVLGLTIAGREIALRALDDSPAGLEELRGVLLQEHT